jgi:hypothetical protein
MTTTKEFDAILDAIDWDAPTGSPTENYIHSSAADSTPSLYELITKMAEIIRHPQQWRQFTSAFREYENAVNAAATLSNNNLPLRPKQVAICHIRARSA